jgi:hypothetical protein
MSSLTLTTIPIELLAYVFEYFIDDDDTLKHLSKAHPKFAPPANAVRHSIRRLLVRGNGAQEACKELVGSIHGSQDETRSGNTLVGPIRYLELVFDSRAQFRLADATQEVLNCLPAIRHVTLKIIARPFPDSQHQDMIENLEEKVRGAVQDYSTLMDMLNTLKPQRKVGLSLILNDCMLRSSPVIAQQYANIVLREFDIKYYLLHFDTTITLAKRLIHATKTLTDMTILEDPACQWQQEQLPCMPFSGLSALKRLHIPASLWFGRSNEGLQGFLWKREEIIRPSIVNLLPPSLSSLRVDFNGMSAVFAVGMGYRAAFFRMTSDEAKMRMKPAWNWIYELVAPDASKLPHLKNVEVLEGLVPADRRRISRTGDHYHSDSVLDWNPPLELKKAFGDRGIKLKIQIRAIKHGKS